MTRLQETGKTNYAFRTISEAATELDVPQHVLRFWETKFDELKPLKRGGQRRYYRPEDINMLREIRDLLYVEGYTIKGVQKLLKDTKTRGSASFVAPVNSTILPRPDENGTARVRKALRELKEIQSQLKRILD